MKTYLAPTNDGKAFNMAVHETLNLWFDLVVEKAADKFSCIKCLHKIDFFSQKLLWELWLWEGWNRDEMKASEHNFYLLQTYGLRMSSAVQGRLDRES